MFLYCWVLKIICVAYESSSDMWLENIFTLSVVCWWSFCSLHSVFNKRKVTKVNKVQLVLFFVSGIVLLVLFPEINHQTTGHSKFIICWIQVLQFCVLHLWPFWVNFCINVRSCWGSFYCIWTSNCSNPTYWKNPPFSIKFTVHLCEKKKSVGYICVGFFLGFLLSSIDLFSSPIHCHLD